MAEVVLQNLSKIYNQGQSNEVVALDNVSFQVKDGEFIVILGASGAGKSTLLNLLGGMDVASSGVYSVGDMEVTSLNDKDLAAFRRNNIGFVFQFYNLMPNLTALENIELAESVSKQTMGAYASLSAVGLDKRANNFPSQLSGGEQQRVAIARAIVKNPDLLLCDEPTGALDSKTGVQIIKLLKEINKTNGTTVIVVTHNALIAEVATRVIRLQDGAILSDTYNESPKEPEDIAW